MKNELIDTFLYELKTRKDLRSQEAYEIAKAILDENLITYNRLAERFVDTPDRIKRLISYACYTLGIKGRSVAAIRTAYIRFLEDEVELLSYDPRKEVAQ